MARFWWVCGALSGLVAVAAGAFGAHVLRPRLEPRMLEVFETAVRYQMYHALALLAVAWLRGRVPGALPGVAGGLLLGGTIAFSGSLYALSLGAPTWLGAVTPLGGLAYLAGWAFLAAAGWRLTRS